MGKSRGRMRSERGLVDKSFLPPDLGHPDRHDAIREELYRVSIGEGAGFSTVYELRAFRETRPDSGRLVYFAIVVTERSGGRRVVVIDPSHGELHAHLYDREGREAARVVLLSFGEGDPIIETAFGFAQDAVWTDPRLLRHMEEW